MNVNAQFMHVLYTSILIIQWYGVHMKAYCCACMLIHLCRNPGNINTWQTSLPDTITSTCRASRLDRALASRTWGPRFDPRACLSDSGDPDDVIVLPDMTLCMSRLLKCPLTWDFWSHKFSIFCYRLNIFGQKASLGPKIFLLGR